LFRQVVVEVAGVLVVVVELVDNYTLAHILHRLQEDTVSPSVVVDLLLQDTQSQVKVATLLY
jgi:hypothetical protein